MKKNKYLLLSFYIIISSLWVKKASSVIFPKVEKIIREYDDIFPVRDLVTDLEESNYYYQKLNDMTINYHGSDYIINASEVYDMEEYTGKQKHDKIYSYDEIIASIVKNSNNYVKYNLGYKPFIDENDIENREICFYLAVNHFFRKNFHCFHFVFSQNYHNY